MFHLSRFASQGNPVFYTFLASPALFHPNLFAAYRHVGQECCDWFSEVGTLHRQPTKLGGSGGIGPHSEGIAYSGIMPCTSTSTATTHSTLSFVSSISVRRQISRDKLCARRPADKGWGASHGHFGQYPATQTAASPGLYHKETMTLMLSSPGSNSHGGGH